MDVPGQIDAHRQVLTPAERKVAAVIVDDPEAVAFGTVADLARRAGASGATVVRLATKLGYDGFVDLQAAVRGEMAHRLRPASERIRRTPVAAGAGDVLARTLRCELGNVAATLEGIDPERFAAAVALLAGNPTGRRGFTRVFILSGDASAGIATLLAGELALLRGGVACVDGSAVHVEAALADAGSADTLVVIDLSRYDREVVDATTRAAARGVRVLAITDSALSPMATSAAVAVTVADSGAGPFDSHVGVLAMLNALLAGVADRLRDHATERLDGVEHAWAAAGVLLED
jgi:DNA-binding MurR/RpiR family transcriptional regulator